MKPVIALTLTALLVGESASAAPFSSTAAPAFNLSIPARLGSVSDTYAPSGHTAPDFIFIQNLHVNRSVQFAISAILKRLEQQGLMPDRLAVEGETGPVDLTGMQTYPDAALRTAASDYLVQQGEMPGSAHFAITEGRVGLFGIETEAYYQANVEMFRRSYAGRQALSRELDKLQAILPCLKKDPAVRGNAEILEADLKAVNQLINNQIIPDELNATLHQTSLAVEHLKQVLPKETSAHLIEPLSASVSFYALALLRNEELFKNALVARALGHQKTTIVITGGFHTAAMAAQCKRQGFSYAVITPHVKRHTKVDERLYVERMLGRHLTPEQVDAGSDWVAMKMVEPRYMLRQLFRPRQWQLIVPALLLALSLTNLGSRAQTPSTVPPPEAVHVEQTDLVTTVQSIPLLKVNSDYEAYLLQGRVDATAMKANTVDGLTLEVTPRIEPNGVAQYPDATEAAPKKLESFEVHIRIWAEHPPEPAVKPVKNEKTDLTGRVRYIDLQAVRQDGHWVWKLPPKASAESASFFLSSELSDLPGDSETNGASVSVSKADLQTLGFPDGARYMTFYVGTGRGINLSKPTERPIASLKPDPETKNPPPKVPIAATIRLEARTSETGIQKPTPAVRYHPASFEQTAQAPAPADEPLYLTEVEGRPVALVAPTGAELLVVSRTESELEAKNTFGVMVARTRQLHNADYTEILLFPEDPASPITQLSVRFQFGLLPHAYSYQITAEKNQNGSWNVTSTHSDSSSAHASVEPTVEGRAPKVKIDEMTDGRQTSFRFLIPMRELNQYGQSVEDKIVSIEGTTGHTPISRFSLRAYKFVLQPFQKLPLTQTSLGGWGRKSLVLSGVLAALLIAPDAWAGTGAPSGESFQFLMPWIFWVGGLFVGDWFFRFVCRYLLEYPDRAGQRRVKMSFLLVVALWGSLLAASWFYPFQFESKAAAVSTVPTVLHLVPTGSQTNLAEMGTPAASAESPNRESVAPANLAAASPNPETLPAAVRPGEKLANPHVSMPPGVVPNDVDMGAPKTTRLFGTSATLIGEPVQARTKKFSNTDEVDFIVVNVLSPDAHARNVAVQITVDGEKSSRGVTGQRIAGSQTQYEFDVRLAKRQGFTVNVAGDYSGHVAIAGYRADEAAAAPQSDQPPDETINLSGAGPLALAIPGVVTAGFSAAASPWVPYFGLAAIALVLLNVVYGVIKWRLDVMDTAHSENVLYRQIYTTLRGITLHLETGSMAFMVLPTRYLIDPFVREQVDNQLAAMRIAAAA